MPLDPELKSLMEEVKQSVGEFNKAKGAIQQLEEQMKGIPSTIENKMKAIRSVAWDDRGRYRGIFSGEDEARGFGLFVLGTVGRSGKALEALKSEYKDVYQRAMGTDTTAAGGGLVPVEYSSRIQRLVEEYGVWPANAFPMDMTSDKLTFQRRTSGVTVYKTGESAAVTGSQPQFDTINLNADEWNALVLYPKTMGEDAAASIGELVAMEMVQAFSEKIDDCGFVGDGTPADLDVFGITMRLTTINGVDDGGGLVLGTGSSGAKWGSLVIDDFLQMVGNTPRYAQRNGKWYCHSAFFWTVMADIQHDGGGNTVDHTAQGPRLQFLGFPVEITQTLPGAGADSHVPCLFGDLRRSSTYGRRKELMIEESRDAKFIERQVAVLGTQRLDINNHSLGDATNAGPVVGLVTPAA